MAGKVTRISDRLSVVDVKGNGPQPSGVYLPVFLNDDELDKLIEYGLARRAKKSREQRKTNGGKNGLA